MVHIIFTFSLVLGIDVLTTENSCLFLCLFVVARADLGLEGDGLLAHE